MSFAAIFSGRAKRQEAERKRKAEAEAKAEADRLGSLVEPNPEPEVSVYSIYKARQCGQALDFSEVDNEGNLKGALKAYDAMYWIFTNQGKYPGPKFSIAYQATKFLQKPLPNVGERIPREKIMEISCIDWCVAHAFGASNDLIGKASSYVNNQILVSALLMSVTAPLFLSPPSFDDPCFQVIVTAVLGLATFFQLFNLVAFTALLNMINAPYTASYTMLARVEAEFYILFLNILVYAGVCMFMSAMLLVAYVGNIIDLYIMMPVVPLIGLFIYILYITSITSREFQRETVYQFYQRYCEYDGKLRSEFLDMVYSDFESMEFGGPMSDEGNGGDAGFGDELGGEGGGNKGGPKKQKGTKKVT